MKISLQIYFFFNGIINYLGKILDLTGSRLLANKLNL